jgi:hypothetical protein
MAYVDQFDNLVRERDRGHAIRHTRTIAVFDDGLAVCAVPVRGGSPVLQAGLLSRLLRAGRVAGGQARPASGGEQIRASARAMSADATAFAFAESWPRAAAIAFAVVDRIVLTRPQQVSKLAIYQETARPGGALRSAYLGDLSAERVRDVLGPLIGDRLKIEVPD